MAELENTLKDIATDAGESFKEFFGRDYVSASGKIAAEFKGDIPVIQTESLAHPQSGRAPAARQKRALQDRAAVGEGAERARDRQGLSKSRVIRAKRAKTGGRCRAAGFADAPHPQRRRRSAAEASVPQFLERRFEPPIHATKPATHYVHVVSAIYA